MTTPVEYTVGYCITLTLKPKLYVATPENQVDYSDLFIRFMEAKGAKLTLVAELTKQYNIHYHGYIELPKKLSKNPIKYIYDVLRKMEYYGFTCIKPCTDYEGWYQYMIKDYYHTKDNININPILLDGLDEYEEIRNVLKEKWQNYLKTRYTERTT